jgi:hypothetical protein
MSRVGTMTLDETTLNKMLNTTESEFMKVNTSSMAYYLPLFQDKLGDDIPLAFELSYSRMDITFGEAKDMDVMAEFTLMLRVKHDVNHPANKDK